MNWTNEQKRAIELRDKNIIVSASAGSGKTTVMVERILSIVKEGADLERMLISTFTKSSAADMREKMYNSLGKIAGTDAHIKRQMEILPQADITNLHSWYQRIIKKYFYYMGIDPSFDILEEGESKIVLSGILDDIIQENLLAGEESFCNLYEKLYTSRNDDTLRKTVQSIYSFAMTRDDPDFWLEHAADSDPEKWKEILLENFSKQQKRLLDRLEELDLKTRQAKFERNYKYIEELKSFLNLQIPTLTIPRGNVSGEFADINEEFKIIKKAAQSLVGEYISSRTMPVECTSGFKTELVRLTKELKERYEAEKADRSLMDFDDLEHGVAKLLDTQGIREEIINSYDYVFVDEYQDINPLQERILNCLAERSLMFYVGDIKQSIYAFRGCEPNIFLERYRKYKSGIGGEAIDFNVNFRSGEVITDFCNGVMSKLMTVDFGGTDYASEAMLKSIRPSEGEVSAFISEKPEEEETENEIYDILQDSKRHLGTSQADCAADYVLSLIEGGADFGDIAVLIRQNSAQVGYLKSCFEARGIPYISLDEETFGSRREIMPIISFLKLLNNFRDEMSLIAVMKSVFGGFTDSELAEIALSEGENFYAKTCNFSLPNVGEKLAAFRKKIEEYYEYSRFFSIYDTVNKLVYEHDYFKYLFASPDPNAPEVLNAFLEHLSDCKYIGSVYEYLNYIKSSSPAFNPPNRTNAVNIMTIHKSKGLEFPHVLFFDTSHQYLKTDYTKDIMFDELGLHLKEWDEENRQKNPTLDWFVASQNQKKRQREEELRLIYVALTRAKNSLAIFGEKGKRNKTNGDTTTDAKDPVDKNSPLDFIYFAITAVEKPVICEEVTKKEDSLILLKSEGALAQELRKRMSFTSPYSRHERKSYVTKIAEATSPIELHRPDFTDSEFSGSESALLKGTAYHEFMEKADFTLPFESQWEKVPEEKRALVDKDLISVAFDEIRKMTSGKSFYRELPFTYNASASYVGGDTGDVLIQGVIDLLIEDDDGFVVVDYKTTRPENVINDVYKTQLDIYSQAVEKVLKKPVKDRYIYSFRLKKCIKI